MNSLIQLFIEAISLTVLGLITSKLVEFLMKLSEDYD